MAIGIPGAAPTYQFYVIYRWNVDPSETAVLFGLPDDDQLFSRWLSIYGFTSRYPQPWSFDAGSASTFVTGVPDDDNIWQNPYRPAFYPSFSVRLLTGVEAFGNAVAAAIVDEDQVYHRAAVADYRNRYPMPWFASGPASLVAPVGIPDADEFTVIQPRVDLATIFGPWSYGSGEEAGVSSVPIDDYTSRSLQIICNSAVYPLPWTFAADSSGMSGLPAEHENWQNPNAQYGLQFKYPQPFAFDVQETSPSPIFDDDMSRWSIVCVSPNYRYAQPWSFDAGSAGAFTPALDDNHWRHLRVAAANATPMPWFDGGAAKLFTVVVSGTIDDIPWVDLSMYARRNAAVAQAQLRQVAQMVLNSDTPEKKGRKLLYITRMQDWLDFEALNRSIIGGP